MSLSQSGKDERKPDADHIVADCNYARYLFADGIVRMYKDSDRQWQMATMLARAKGNRSATCQERTPTRPIDDGPLTEDAFAAASVSAVNGRKRGIRGHMPFHFGQISKKLVAEP